MSLDLTSFLIIGFAALVVSLGLGRIYFESIQDFFLRRIVFAATRLVFLVQDTGDEIYTRGWALICTCLEEIENQSDPETIEGIFQQLFKGLNQKKLALQSSENPITDEMIIHRAINIASVWRISIRSEVAKAEKISNLKIEPNKFVKMIKDLNI